MSCFSICFRLIILVLGSLQELTALKYSIGKDFDGPPDVFILGVQKSATTSLNTYLVYEEEAFINSHQEKEPHFFSFHFNPEGFKKYMEGFHSLAHLNRRFLDSTPGYLFFENALENMKRLYSVESIKKKKFIVILREPVSRLFSWYRHIYGECSAHYGGLRTNITETYGIFCSRPPFPNSVYTDTFHAFLHSGRKFRSVERGHYLLDLKRWLNFIERDQLFIIKQSTLVKFQNDSITRLLQFLDVAPRYPKSTSHFLPHANGDLVHCRGCNLTELKSILCTDLHMLEAYYDNHNKGLVQFINQGSGTRPPTEPEFAEFSMESLHERCI
jgi:hypothetical protein